MNPALGLIAIYVIITGLLQVAGFAVSRLVEVFQPTFGLMTFLVLYLGMFWVGWPIAVRVAEALIPGARSDPAKPANGV